MAIAGSAMMSCKVRLINNELIGTMWMMRQSDTLVDTASEALAILLRGETVFLRTTGAQFVELGKLVKERMGKTDDL